MSQQPPRRADILADLLGNLGKLMLALLVVIVFGVILVAFVLALLS